MFPGVSVTYTCILVVNADLINTAVVTAKPPSGPNVTASDTAIIDVLPKITVSTSANVMQVIFTGAPVTFKFVVKNESNEPVTITGLSDSEFGTLAGSATCQVGTVLPAKMSCSFTLTQTISGLPGTTHLNVFSASVVDNENNVAMGTSDAEVYFYWKGRTAIYWKDHTNQWPTFTVTGSSGIQIAITKSTLVRTIFKIPASYTCIKSTDMLIKALGYNNGTDSTCTATQILVRTATAAILNKKVYGASYPNFNSPQEIVDAVNAAILSNNRAAIIDLAHQFGYGNSGVG